jgi:hypothetical protein
MHRTDSDGSVVESTVPWIGYGKFMARRCANANLVKPDILGITGDHFQIERNSKAIGSLN